MLQNKLLFNQSSVSLEIIGLPDYSDDENKDKISIISQWKLIIIDKPLIEGNINHLSSIMEAFYSYSNFLLNKEVAFYESILVDIKADDFYTHNIVFKSSKPNVKPLNIKIGNAVLSDIVNCFDQFNASTKVRKVEINVLNNTPKTNYLTRISKDKISNLLLPPLISLCSLFLISSTYIYFYNEQEVKENNAYINVNNITPSTNSLSTIL